MTRRTRAAAMLGGMILMASGVITLAFQGAAAAGDTHGGSKDCVGQRTTAALVADGHNECKPGDNQGDHGKDGDKKGDHEGDGHKTTTTTHEVKTTTTTQATTSTTQLPYVVPFVYVPPTTSTTVAPTTTAAPTTVAPTLVVQPEVLGVTETAPLAALPNTGTPTKGLAAMGGGLILLGAGSLAASRIRVREA